MSADYGRVIQELLSAYAVKYGYRRDAKMVCLVSADVWTAIVESRECDKRFRYEYDWNLPQLPHLLSYIHACWTVPITVADNVFGVYVAEVPS